MNNDTIEQGVNQEKPAIQDNSVSEALTEIQRRLHEIESVFDILKPIADRITDHTGGQHGLDTLLKTVATQILGVRF